MGIVQAILDGMFPPTREQIEARLYAKIEMRRQEIQERRRIEQLKAELKKAQEAF